jgi:hypothetical protein
VTDYRLEDFKTRVRTIARVSNDTTNNDLVTSYVNDVIKRLSEDVKVAELLATTSKAVGETDTVDFSVSDPYLNINSIIAIRDPNGIGGDVAIIDSEIFDRAQIDQTSTSGYPKCAIPLSSTKLKVYPYGSLTTWEISYHKDHFDFTADSQTMTMPDTAFKTVCDGVIAELLAYKDDDRVSYYEAKYADGVNRLKRARISDNRDLRMQPGTPNMTNADWERIFGD